MSMASGENRETIREDLGVIRGLWREPWCLGGDFNIIRFPEERNREGRISGPMRRFSQIIDDLELKDLPLQGGCFTWKGGMNNQRMARLDKFLVIDDWDVFFGGSYQRLLPGTTFDHSPLLLVGGGVSARGPMPFRFENMWLKADGFKNLIINWWQSTKVIGSGSYVLVEKVKALKSKLRHWNKEEFGRVEDKKKTSLKQVAHWDAMETQRPPSMREKEEKVKAIEDFKRWAFMEEISWR